MGIKEFIAYCKHPTKEKIFATAILLALLVFLSGSATAILILYPAFFATPPPGLELENLRSAEIVLEPILEKNPSFWIMVYPAVIVALTIALIFGAIFMQFSGEGILIISFFAIPALIFNIFILYLFLYPFGCFVVIHKSWKKGIGLMVGVTLILLIILKLLYG